MIYPDVMYWCVSLPPYALRPFPVELDKDIYGHGEPIKCVEDICKNGGTIQCGGYSNCGDRTESYSMSVAVGSTSNLWANTSLTVPVCTIVKRGK